MEDKVVELLRKLKMNKSYSFEKIAEKLEITDKEGLKELKRILDKKVDENEILLTPLNTYKHMAKTSYRRGIFHANRSGGGKVLVVTSYEKFLFIIYNSIRSNFRFTYYFFCYFISKFIFPIFKLYFI